MFIRARVVEASQRHKSVRRPKVARIKLTPDQKAKAAEQLKKRALATYPGAHVTAHVEDETDDEGKAVGATVSVSRIKVMPKDWKPSE